MPSAGARHHFRTGSTGRRSRGGKSKQSSLLAALVLLIGSASSAEAAIAAMAADRQVPGLWDKVIPVSDDSAGSGAEAAAERTPEENCNDNDADTRIAGCTQLIESGGLGDAEFGL